MAKNKDKNLFAETASNFTPKEVVQSKTIEKENLDKSNKVKKNEKKNITAQHVGHRQRLRHRYNVTNGSGFEDYEYLELLLFRSIPRADTKPIAKALIDRFGSLADVLGADLHLLQEVQGCGPAVANDLKFIADIIERINYTELRKRDVFSSWDKVLAYCKAAMAHETREQFRVFFLDKKNGLIANEVQQVGTVDHTPVYPREVVRRALQLNASSLILVHNHPSGDPSPSREDITMTHTIKDVANALGITIHDHIIIARHGHTSFRAMKLL